MQNAFSILTLCWKKLGSKYLSNRSSNFTLDGFQLTWNTLKQTIYIIFHEFKINIYSYIYIFIINILWKHVINSQGFSILHREKCTQPKNSASRLNNQYLIDAASTGTNEKNTFWRAFLDKFYVIRSKVNWHV